MSPQDWLAATDDLLCARWGRRCLVCGRTPVAYADLHTTATLALAVGLCAACHQRDPQREAVERLLAQRYGGGG